MPMGLPRMKETTATRLTRILGGCCAVVALLLFGYIAVISLLQTNVFDPQELSAEIVLYLKDNPLWGLLITVAYGAVAWLLGRVPLPRHKHYDTLIIAVTALLVTAIGLWWILLCQSVPAADSGQVFDTAQAVIKGNFSAFHVTDNEFYGYYSYYRLYPFQLGYVFISEIVYRLTGADTAIPMQVVNVVALAAMYVALLLIARRLYRHRLVVTLCAILLVGCLQPIFFCSFAYGNIIGFSAGVWAGYCTLRYMQSTSKRRYLLWIPLCLLCAVAVLAKYNNLIWVVAIAITLLLDALQKRRILSLLILPALVLTPLLAQSGVTALYEHRSGVDLGNGISQTVYFYDGLQESWMAPGWYSDSGKSLFVENGCDPAATDAVAKERIRQRLEEMKKSPAYTVDFFNKKLLSQWNEPAYECLWVSQVKAHYNGAVQEGTLLHNVYHGTVGDLLNGWFNVYQSALLIWFCAGVLLLLKRGVRPVDVCLMAMPIGGALYHLLFEAKSQYLLTYFILMTVFATVALCRVADIRTKGVSNL